MVQEILHHGNALLCPPTLQHRTLSRLYPHIAVERSPTAVSPVSQSRCRSVGPVPLPARVSTLPVPGLQAHLQRPHRAPVAPELATVGLLDPRPLSVVPRLFVPA